MRDPLAAMGDKALAWVGDLALRMGPDTLHARCPKFIDWLGGEVCREQARRRGEAVPEPEDFLLDALADAELLRLGEVAAQMALACRQLPFALAHDDEGRRRPPVRPALADADREPLLEVVGLLGTVTAAVREALAQRPAPQETLH